MSTFHLLVGDNDMLLHRALRDLAGELAAGDESLTIDVHDADELDHLPSLRTMSLLGDRTGVAIRGLESRRAGGLRDEIAAFLDEPDDEAVLLLASNGKRPVMKVSKRMKKVGTVTEVYAPKPWDDAGWGRIVQEEFTRAGVAVGRDVVDAVRAHAGVDVAAIIHQVRQVLAQADGEVTAALVDEVLTSHGEQTAFAVVDAVVDRDVEQALVAYRGFIESSGAAPVMLAGALASRFRQLLAIRGGATSPSDVGASPGQIRHLTGPARNNFGPGELAWAQQRIAQLDVELKGGSALDSALAMELAVIELATPRAVEDPRFNPLVGKPTG